MHTNTIIIPCYNEARRINLVDFVNHHAVNPWMHFCFVDDCSTDRTHEILTEFCCKYQEWASVVSCTVHSGKSTAVRHGILHALNSQCAYVGYMDADLATPLTEMAAMVKTLAERPELLMCFGSRLKRLGASIKRHPLRHLLGRLFATATSLLLDLPVYDTQCGAKVFTAGAAHLIFAEPFISRWFFDVEIFARMVRSYGSTVAHTRLLEFPLLQWHDVGGSHLKLHHILLAPAELLRIRHVFAGRPRGGCN